MGPSQTFAGPGWHHGRITVRCTQVSSAIGELGLGPRRELLLGQPPAGVEKLLSYQVAFIDDLLEETVAREESARSLRTVPSVGPVTALPPARGERAARRSAAPPA